MAALRCGDRMGAAGLGAQQERAQPRTASEGAEQRSGWFAQHRFGTGLLQLHLPSVWVHGAAAPVLHREVLGKS